MLGISVISNRKSRHNVDVDSAEGGTAEEDSTMEMVEVKKEELSEEESIGDGSGGYEASYEDGYDDDDEDLYEGAEILEMPECEVDIVPGDDGSIEGVYIKDEPDEDLPEATCRVSTRKRRGSATRRSYPSKKRRTGEMSTPDHQEEKKKYTCDVCGVFEARTPREIASHRRTAHGPRPYKCSQCPYSAKSQSLLNRHNMTHAGIKPFACALCPFRTLNPSNLELHSLTHDIASRTVSCDECEYTTTRLRLLQQHKAIHRRTEASGVDVSNLHKCGTCGYITSKPSHLRQHLLTHTNERPFACPYCRYSAKQSSHLHQHLVRHTGQRRYPCEQCSYVASQAVHLEQHRSARHNGVRRYQCSECPYVAAHCSSLSKHKASHVNGWKLKKPRP